MSRSSKKTAAKSRNGRDSEEEIRRFSDFDAIDDATPGHSYYVSLSSNHEDDQDERVMNITEDFVQSIVGTAPDSSSRPSHRSYRKHGNAFSQRVGREERDDQPVNGGMRDKRTGTPEKVHSFPFAGRLQNSLSWDREERQRLQEEEDFLNGDHYGDPDFPSAEESRLADTMRMVQNGSEALSVTDTIWCSFPRRPELAGNFVLQLCDDDKALMVLGPGHVHGSADAKLRQAIANAVAESNTNSLASIFLPHAFIGTSKSRQIIELRAGNRWDQYLQLRFASLRSLQMWLQWINTVIMDDAPEASHLSMDAIDMPLLLFPETHPGAIKLIEAPETHKIAKMEVASSEAAPSIGRTGEQDGGRKKAGTGSRRNSLQAAGEGSRRNSLVDMANANSRRHSLLSVPVEEEQQQQQRAARGGAGVDEIEQEEEEEGPQRGEEEEVIKAASLLFRSSSFKSKKGEDSEVVYDHLEEDSVRSSSVRLNKIETLAVPKIPPSESFAHAKDMMNKGFHSTATLLSSTALTYPFWNPPEGIVQNDVTEDGMPPDERARPSNLHVDLEVTVIEGHHFPKEDSLPHEKCDPFCMLTFNEQQVKTQVMNQCYDCVWNERFGFFIHSCYTAMALKDFGTDRKGPAIMLECYDWNLIKKDEFIGQTEIRLADILQSGAYEPDGYTLDVTIRNSEGQEVVGYDGKLTQVKIRFKAAKNSDAIEWVPPTLEQTLHSSEGAIKLRKAHTTQNTPYVARQQLSRMNSVFIANPPVASTLGAGENSSMKVKKVHRTSTVTEFDEAVLPSATEGMPDDEDAQNDKTDHEMYWREKLEHRMESLTVNIFVMILVMVDISSIIVFTLIVPVSEDAPDPIEQITLTVFVLACFVVELSLRQIAQRHRFWLNIWNIFDFFVIWASVSIAVVKYVYDITTRNGGSASDDVEITRRTATTLRIISRVAMGLRVARVLVNLRKARALGGNVTRTLRSAVSQNRRRYKKHGFDLDLTYITDRVVAMSAPAFGGHTAYRNDINVVSRFLSLRHYGSFFVYNFCDTYFSGDGVMGNYHPQMLFNQVQRVPFEDHGPPLMSEMIKFCEEAAKWLEMDQKNTIAVHCKGGKGRTGVMVAAFLMWTGHRRCAMDAMELFTFRRTANYDPEAGLGDADPDDSDAFKALRRTRRINQGPEGPSQIRYVHYMEAMLYSGIDPLAQTSMLLKDMSFVIGTRDTWFLSFSVRCNRCVMHDSHRIAGRPHEVYGEVGKTLIRLPCTLLIHGDTRIDFFLHKSMSATSTRKLAFFITFNTAFYPDKTVLSFRKQKIDILHRNNKIAPDFTIHVNVDPSPGSCERMLVGERFVKLFDSFPRVKIARDEMVLTEDDTDGKMALVMSGAVEGIVHESFEGHNEKPYHPMGNTLPDKLDKGPTSSVRVPTITMLGRHSVLGASGFLSDAPHLGFRARSNDVEVCFISRAVDGVGAEDVHPGDSASGVTRSKWTDPQQHAHRGGRRKSTDTWESVIGAPPDIAVQGVRSEDLAHFYQGLALNISTQLSRARLEAIRMSGLKAFNDRQSVMHLQGEVEQLRDCVIKGFGLPVNEKVLYTSKCSCTSISIKKSTEEAKIKAMKIRIIVMSRFLLLDPEIFGPYISKQSEIIRIDQLHHVQIKSEYQKNTIVLQVQGEKVHGLDLVANMKNYEFTFQHNDRVAQVLAWLTHMCQKAHLDRERERIRPFETPYMESLLERCSKVHELKKGDFLKEGSTTDSLFIIRTGSIKLTRDTAVHRLLREGGCFGATDFVEQTVSGKYLTIASTASVVLELPSQSVSQLCSDDPQLGALFYWTICQILDSDYREAMEEMFPGTWSRKLHTDVHGAPQMVSPPNAVPDHEQGSPVARAARPTPRTGMPMELRPVPTI